MLVRRKQQPSLPNEPPWKHPRGSRLWAAFQEQAVMLAPPMTSGQVFLVLVSPVLPSGPPCQARRQVLQREREAGILWMSVVGMLLGLVQPVNSPVASRQPSLPNAPPWKHPRGSRLRAAFQEQAVMLASPITSVQAFLALVAPVLPSGLPCQVRRRVLPREGKILRQPVNSLVAFRQPSPPSVLPWKRLQFPRPGAARQE